MEQVITKINRYEELMEAVSKLQQSKQALIESVIPKKIKAKLEDIDAEFDSTIENLEQQLKDIEEEIKQAVLDSGETANGKTVKFVYTSGRVTWDNKKMEVLLESIPELNIARKAGNPYVSVKKA